VVVEESPSCCLARSGRLTISVKHRSIEWPCGIMAEVDAEGSQPKEDLGSGYTGKAGDPHSNIVTTFEAKESGAPGVL
jgi:hypothetical protein